MTWVAIVLIVIVVILLIALLGAAVNQRQTETKLKDVTLHDRDCRKTLDDALGLYDTAKGERDQAQTDLAALQNTSKDALERAQKTIGDLVKERDDVREIVAQGVQALTQVEGERDAARADAQHARDTALEGSDRIMELLGEIETLKADALTRPPAEPAGPSGLTPQTARALLDGEPCVHCGRYHPLPQVLDLSGTPCPRVRRYERDAVGNVRVRYWPEGDYTPEGETVEALEAVAEPPKAPERAEAAVTA